MGNNFSKFKMESRLLPEERKILTNFIAIDSKVLRATTVRKTLKEVLLNRQIARKFTAQ